MADSDIRAGRYRRLPALLYERFLSGNLPPLLVFQQSRLDDARANVTFADSISAGDLLAQWPERVPERIDRCLCNLGRYKPGAGEAIELPTRADKKRDVLLFAENASEARYYIKAMMEYGWISNDVGHQTSWGLVITPHGWTRIGELTRGAERNRNPAFVAMWFGGDDPADQERMSGLFTEAIRAACHSCGWSAERVDSTEHNDSIIDRIVAMIRVAPFVIAELSDDNRGVYYEAGFARGLGRDVTYLVREGSNVHFDLSGVNHVRWQTPADLKVKLENRILGTFGRGPHKFDS